MEVPSIKEPWGKPVVSGSGRQFHCGAMTLWYLTKHHSENLHLWVQSRNASVKSQVLLIELETA